MKSKHILISAVLSFALLIPTVALATPDVEDSVIFTESLFGFWTGVKVVHGMDYKRGIEAGQLSGKRLVDTTL